MALAPTLAPGLGQDLPRILLAAAMLLGAAVLDLRSRRVANLYWFPFLAFALVLDGADLAGGAWLPAAAAAVLCGLFYLMWRFGLFGGADAKGLMVLSLLLPLQVGPFPVPAVLASLGLASLLAGVGVPLALGAWNALHGRFALPAMLLGVPMPLERARRTHVWPMQDAERQADGSVRLAWRYLRHIGTDVDARLDALAAAGIARPWVTPKVPFMLPLLLGVLLWPALAPLVPWPAA